MDNNSNGQGRYDAEKDLDELLKRYSLDNSKNDTDRDIFSYSDRRGDIHSNHKTPTNNQNHSNNDRSIDVSSRSNDIMSRRPSSNNIGSGHQNSVHNRPTNSRTSSSQMPNNSINKPINNRQKNQQNKNHAVNNYANNKYQTGHNDEKKVYHPNSKEKLSKSSLMNKIYKKNTDKYIDDSTAPRYKGEVYFSSYRPQNQEMFIPSEQSQDNNNNKSKKEKKKNKNKNKNRLTISRIVKKPKGRRRTQGEKKVLNGYLAIMLVVTILFTFWSMSCLNDIFAFKKSDEKIKITVPKDASTSKMISIFHKNDLINNSLFCKTFLGLTSGLRSNKPEYLQGVYELKPDMGVENMLKKCQRTTAAKTVDVVFPEGWTIQEMAEKLEEKKVCTKEAFYDNLNASMYEFDFTKDIKNKKGRYQNLEGYMFPAQYEFFINENPSSIVKKMLTKFDTEWTDEYDKKAKELGMSIDEVITLASLIQSEAGSVEQMPKISAVFHNRLDNPSNFSTLQSDASTDYVKKNIKINVKSSELDSYSKKYDTYKCTGLPAGSICNPGKFAIEAALNPENSKNLYFCHNTKSKELYLARTLPQHNINLKRAGLKD